MEYTAIMNCTIMNDGNIINKEIYNGNEKKHKEKGEQIEFAKGHFIKKTHQWILMTLVQKLHALQRGGNNRKPLLG